MKIFGRKESDTSTVLNDQEKRLQLAIDAVTSSLKVNNITNELEAELVLSALLENFGYQLDTQQLRDHDFTIEQNQQQILRMIDEVHELLCSSLSTPVIQAALSSFVFNAGVAYGTQPDVVQSAYVTMLETDSSKAFLSLIDEDTLFAGQLKKYVLSLDASESKAFIASLKKGSSEHAQQLNSVFDKLETASASQQAKAKKEVNKASGKSAGARSSEPSSSPKFCGNCGSSLNAGAKFCGSCGSSTASS